MGLISNIENSFQNLSVTDPKAWNPSVWNLAGSQSLTGEQVNEATALTYSAVYNANYILSTTISTLPLQLMQDEGDKRTRATDDPLYNVMHSEFNPYMTAQVGREVLMSHTLMWGNGYAEIVRDSMGNIIQLWPIAPNRIRMDMKDGVLFYWVRVDSEDVPLRYEDVLHVPGLGFDGFQGYSVISMARKSIGLSMAMETFGSLSFGQGITPSAVITHPQKITDSKVRKALTKTYAGLGNTSRLMILEDGMTINTDLGIPYDDKMFLDSRVFQISEVARWFNLPLHKLKEMTRSTNNNIESEQISFVTDTNLPWLIRFEQTYDQQLLRKAQKKQKGMFFRHNVDGLLRGNAKDRAEYYKVMVLIGAMSINDVREKEDFDKVDHKFADDYFVQLNMIPLTMLEEHLNKQNTLQSPSQSSDSQDSNNSNNNNTVNPEAKRQRILSLISEVQQ